MAYRPIILFPRYRDFNRPADLRKYVETEMVELARSRTLYLTDHLTQPEPLRTTCSEIIMGHWVGPGNKHRTDATIPRELRTYTIKLQAIEGRKIRFKAGANISTEEEYRRGRATADLVWYEDNWIEYPGTEAEVSLEEGVWALKWAGENVRLARNKNQKEAWWHYREVRPVEATPLKRKVG